MPLIYALLSQGHVMYALDIESAIQLLPYKADAQLRSESNIFNIAINVRH